MEILSKGLKMLMSRKNKTINEIATSCGCSEEIINNCLNDIDISKEQEEKIFEYLKEENILDYWSFNITVMFGRCDGGDSDIDYPVTIDQYKILKIASVACTDFDCLDDLIETLQTFDLDEYLDWDINIEECGYTFDDIKEIDFENLDMVCEDEVWEAAYDQEKRNYIENFGDDEEDDDFDFDVRVYI